MISDYLAKEMQGYFVGKLCTIMTPPIAMGMTDKTFPQWFTVMVEGIDREAIVGTDVRRGTKHIFFFPIIGIAEEQVIKPEHPDYSKIKNQAEKVIKKIPDSKPEPAPVRPDFITIESLQKTAANLKKSAMSQWKTSDKPKE